MRNGFILLLLVLSVSVHAQDIEIPTDPLAGRLVFEEKQCIVCHNVGGFGGTAGPDLSRELYFGSSLDLASVIWNHTPEMNRKFRQLRMNRPTLTEKEMLDLLGFLYYLRYLGEPGSVSNGRRLLSSKGCLTCHRIGAEGGSIGPDFTTVPRYSAPLYMIQAMWNHGPAMKKRIEETKSTFPVLTGQDITDITSYLREVSNAEVEARLSPGNPRRGADLFETKHCTNCHVGEGKRKRIEPGLLRLDLRKGVTEVASDMWNHGQVMMDAMKAQAIEWPTFEGNEMADVIAYIYFLGFQDQPGNPDIGERVFTEKGCVGCHEKSGVGKAPNLQTAKGFDSPIRMVQLMWNHAGEMEDLLITQNKNWPELSKGELCDLYAFLRRASGQ